jgi:glycine C-acetyltransferase
MPRALQETAMREDFYSRVQGTLRQIDAEGLTKPERVILSRQGAAITVRGGNGEAVPALNFCANNYLGLAGDTRVAAAASRAVRDFGAGLSSVRFICGTQSLHKELEREIADYLGHEDAILFAAAFDANGGLFEPLLDEQDAIVSDSLNHASIIDGVRLCKAKRYRFPNGDMAALETSLGEAKAAGARTIVIATDGVFSMDGHIAKLDEITALAARFGALVMVDDCHATGFLGPEGRGSAAFQGVEGKIDFLTGTFGKALGGAMGGFVTAKKEVVALLRQRARPYLFSNALAPAVCGAALEAIRIARSPEGDDLRRQLFANAELFRAGMSANGFALVAGEHPIVPVMLGDARLAQSFAAELMREGIYVIGFSYPVVPKGQARIRVQLSAAHSRQNIEQAIAAFVRVRERVEHA